MISLTNAKRRLDGFPTIAALPPHYRAFGGGEPSMPAGWWSYGLVLLTTPSPAQIPDMTATPATTAGHTPAAVSETSSGPGTPLPAKTSTTPSRTPRIYRVVRPNPVPSMRDHPSRKQSIITWNSGLTRGQMNAGRSKAMPMAGETVRMAAIRPTASNPLDGWQGRRRRHDACAPSPASRSLRYISGMSRSWSWSLAQTTGLPAASERGTSRMRWFLDPRNCRRESCWSLR